MYLDDAEKLGNYGKDEIGLVTPTLGPANGSFMDI